MRWLLPLLFPVVVHAATVSVDTTTIPPGECTALEWGIGATRKLPVAVCRRTPEQLAALQTQSEAEGEPLLLRSVSRFADTVVDSRIASQMQALQQQLQYKPSRSLRDELLVVINMEPAIGCLLKADFASAQKAFTNPCHGNTFDSNGRILDASTLPYSTYPLRIPPHHYRGATLVIGELDAAAVWHDYDFRPDLHDLSLTPEQRLLLAARWGMLAEVERLLQEGADINASHWKFVGSTALLEAVSKQHLEVVRLLLQRGADPNIATEYGTTALKLAHVVENAELVGLLESFGALDVVEKAKGEGRP